ncbi:uncharacterized protein [Palaemon carinicauda]
MVSKCFSLRKQTFPLSTGCMVLSGGIQMVGSLSLANSIVMLLLLLAGLWNFIFGVSLIATGGKVLSRDHSQTSRRRKLCCVSLMLVLTTVVLVVAILLVHLERIRIIDPWTDVVSSQRRTLEYASISQSFDDIGVWVVTATSIIGAISSLFALWSTFPFGLSNTFSLHNNLATMESLGWVYESTPRPDVLQNCPPLRQLQTHVNAHRYKPRKSALKSKSVTLVSFKHEASMDRQTNSLPVRSSKDRRIVFVDSWQLAPTLPINMDFGKSFPIGSPRSQRGNDLPLKSHCSSNAKCQMSNNASDQGNSYNACQPSLHSHHNLIKCEAV